jgi:hypothetical protein
MIQEQLTALSRLEADLWEAADQLRANSKLTSSEYCMPVLGIIFLRHATNRFEAVTRQIEADQASDRMPRRPPIRDNYAKRRALYWSEEARYDSSMALPKEEDLDLALVDAMTAIEKAFEPLDGVLPKEFTIFERTVLEDLLRIFNREALRSAGGDLFGRIYEYFLMKFAIQGAQDNGEFFTPPSPVQTIVNVIEPDHGTVFDPAAGSAGMFVQSSHFIERLGQDTTHRVTFFGQEKTATTIRLAKMNLAVHGLEGDIREANTFYTEQHLQVLGFDVSRLRGATGFERIEALSDATNAVYTSDEAKRRFEILARLVFARFKALLMEPTAFIYAERHDNLEAIYKKLQERRDTSDVTELLKELHTIVNEAIRTQEAGADHAEGLTVDLSQLDFQKLRDEFAKVRRKRTLLQDLRDVVEQKLQQMLRYNPQRMDYYKKYQEIIADYNREKDRATVEETFTQLIDLANSLDAEQRRAAEEGLSEGELALFDLLSQAQISKADRERLKQASKGLLTALQELLKPMENWTQKEQTQAEVKVFILDHLFATLPNPPYSTDDTQAAADRIYEYVWQRSAGGNFLGQGQAA